MISKNLGPMKHVALVTLWSLLFTGLWDWKIPSPATAGALFAVILGVHLLSKALRWIFPIR